MKSNKCHLKAIAVIGLALSLSLVSAIVIVPERREGNSLPQIAQATIVPALPLDNSATTSGNKSKKQPAKQEEPSLRNPPALSPITLAPIAVNGCQTAYSLGSPILLISQIAEHIVEHMKLDNQNSFVRYLYSAIAPGSSPFNKMYTMIWELSTASSKAYVGISVDSIIYGIGSVKFKKFIYHANIDTIKKVLKINSPIPTTSLSCGDQKIIFSSYGNDPRGRLPGSYPGFNYNAIPPMILKLLQELQKSSVSAEPPKRDCDQSRFINSSSVYFRLPIQNSAPAVVMPTNKDNPLEYQNYFELSRCNPTSEPIVESLDLYCQFICCPTVTGALVGVEATFKVPFQPGKLETLPLVGSKPTSSIKITIPLHGVTRVEAFYPANGSYYAIKTYNELNSMVGEYYCGNNAEAAVNQGRVPQDSVLVKDLLGVYGGWKSDPLVTAPQFSYFGFVKYV